MTQGGAETQKPFHNRLWKFTCAQKHQFYRENKGKIFKLGALQTNISKDSQSETLLSHVIESGALHGHQLYTNGSDDPHEKCTHHSHFSSGHNPTFLFPQCVHQGFSTKMLQSVAAQTKMGGFHELTSIGAEAKTVGWP